MNLRTPLATKVVGGVSLLAVAALSWSLVIGPQGDDLSQAEEGLASARDQNATLTLRLTQLERQRSNLASTRRSAEELAEKFPPTADQPELFKEVTEAAAAAGIGSDGVTALTPTPPTLDGVDGTTQAEPAADGSAPVAAGGIGRQTVVVSASGSYDQTIRLLENLEHIPRAYLITAVSLSADESTELFTTTVSGDMFVLAPATDPGEALNLSSPTRTER